jgi:hypothetical protein
VYLCTQTDTNSSVQEFYEGVKKAAVSVSVLRLRHMREEKSTYCKKSSSVSVCVSMVCDVIFYKYIYI